MSGINMLALKAKQDEDRVREDDFLRFFIPFRDSLVSELCQLIEEAVQCGLRGAKSCVRRRYTDEYVEVALGLNDFNLALIATNHVYFLGPDDWVLAARLFVYVDGDEDVSPFLEIVVREHDGGYLCVLQWRITGGQRREIQRTRKPATEAGQHIADALFGHLYNIQRFWEDKGPWLKKMQTLGPRKEHLGFRLPEQVMVNTEK